MKRLAICARVATERQEVVSQLAQCAALSIRIDSHKRQIHGEQHSLRDWHLNLLSDSVAFREADPILPAYPVPAMPRRPRRTCAGATGPSVALSSADYLRTCCRQTVQLLDKPGELVLQQPPLPPRRGHLHHHATDHQRLLFFAHHRHAFILPARSPTLSDVPSQPSTYLSLSYWPLIAWSLPSPDELRSKPPIVPGSPCVLPPGAPPACVWRLSPDHLSFPSPSRRLRA